MNPFASLLSWLCDGYWPTADGHEDLVVHVPDALHNYTPLRLLASGDAAEIHLATAAGESSPGAEALYLLKVARHPESNAHLDRERQALTTLRKASGTTTYQHYLPALVDTFSATDPLPQRINVFRWEPGFYSLEAVHAQHPALDGRHLAWIFNRLLTVLGFCHRHHLLHGAVLPCHALIHPASHGLRLVGWGGSAAVGQRLRAVPARYQNWYPAEVQHHKPARPATDLFLAARCLVYLAGGDPVTSRMPEAVPAPMRRFVETCLFESISMRPGDAWALMDDFNELLHALYGPPRFHDLPLI
jgi:serine/threonine protein kinase